MRHVTTGETTIARSLLNLPALEELSRRDLAELYEYVVGTEEELTHHTFNDNVDVHTYRMALYPSSAPKVEMAIDIELRETELLEEFYERIVPVATQSALCALGLQDTAISLLRQNDTIKRLAVIKGLGDTVETLMDGLYKETESGRMVIDEPEGQAQGDPPAPPGSNATQVSNNSKADTKSGGTDA